MSKSLYEYDFPKDLKKMTFDELDLLSYQIRDFLIEKVSKTGGHLAPNLGVVELTLALHFAFNSPKDKMIWDVGHQSYVHKILTGRAKGFDSLRQFGGMSGFPKICESPHDVFDTGHSSTAISLAMGMAVSRDVKHDDYNIVAIIGDGAMTGGLAFEGLNNISESGRRVIVILNDNGMSISPNIGGLAKHLRNLRTSNQYLNIKKTARKVVDVPYIGDSLYKGMRNAKDHMKYALLPKGVLFEELGLTYLGPVDGHNVEELVNAMQAAKKINGPVLIHAITKKGKGYRSAENNPDKFHGIGSFNPCTGLPNPSKGVSYSSIAGDEILSMAKDHDDVVAVSAAMCDATGLRKFADKFPERFFDVGIAEAHGVTFSAGMAASGLRPVVAIYSSFLQRAYDQILEDVCIQKLPVIFAIDRAGVVGADGETHHGNFDIAYLSTMPNMTVFTPNGEKQLREAFRIAYSLKSPCAIRYPRGECPINSDTSVDSNFSSENAVTELTKYATERYCSGQDVDIWAVGRMQEKAKDIRGILEDKGMSVGIVNVKMVKPIDLSQFDDKSGLIVTLEDGTLNGGFGEQFSSMLFTQKIDTDAFENSQTSLIVKNEYNNKIITIGWPDKFIEHGDLKSLEKKYSLDAKSIAEAIKSKYNELNLKR
ncbi:MAG: 1-deoxy-D-xylulose-5-phosphate synthase [Christensenellales bacterium]